MEGDFYTRFSEEVDKVSEMEQSHESIVMVKEHECGFHFSTDEVNEFGCTKFCY